MGFSVLGIPEYLNRFLFLASRLPHPVPSQGLDSQHRTCASLHPRPHLVRLFPRIRGAIQVAPGLLALCERSVHPLALACLLEVRPISPLSRLVTRPARKNGAPECSAPSCLALGRIVVALLDKCNSGTSKKFKNINLIAAQVAVALSMA